MITKARKGTMNPGLMKIGVWNVRGLYGKKKLLQEKLKKMNCGYSSNNKRQDRERFYSFFLKKKISVESLLFVSIHTVQ